MARQKNDKKSYRLFDLCGEFFIKEACNRGCCQVPVMYVLTSCSDPSVH
jgi:hypothetical protein